MRSTTRRNGIIAVLFGIIMLAIVMLAFSSTTWAAPGAQGTVPTPPGPTSVATTTPGDDTGGNDNNGGDNNNNDNSNNGGSNDNTAQPTPAAPGAGVVCAIGDAGAQCSASDLIVVVGAGAASPGSALTIEGSFPQPPCPSSPANHTFLNRCYRYTWIGTNALPINAISAPVQYCIGYGAEQLATVKNNADALLMGVATADGNWTLLKATADAANNRTCATTNQLIVWSALFAPQNPATVLPTVGGSPNSWWLAALVGVGFILLIGAVQFRRRAR